MTAHKYVLTLLLLAAVQYGFGEVNKRVYLVKSAYYALYFSEKKSFEPFKEIKTSRNEWLFEFSASNITFRRELTEIYEIIKTEHKKSNERVYAVRDQKGSTSVIEFKPIKVDSYVSININIVDLNKNSSYKAITAIQKSV